MKIKINDKVLYYNNIYYIKNIVTHHVYIKHETHSDDFGFWVLKRDIKILLNCPEYLINE